MAGAAAAGATAAIEEAGSRFLHVSGRIVGHVQRMVMLNGQ